ncbi:MAG: bifunctional riboflavin kinase/FAD synthetase [Gracilimonas sp.]|uniref:bifunctional riboflavin kinase/FAD synthetase n=1 Tax=Gracilimonas TaxID=649462 RepID=UPI001AFDE6D8|nr:bifunctional riboflavin kinase/FAD synthetase [Gracilimonas sp.]MBO6586292.1 bifunctional riboflavin kinase/FAD synthetase [Gracilimonas sp.]MBO6614949.1 bifunctional riboflavin kinase/FAD synthetase [Gracilimonas sp.]
MAELIELKNITRDPNTVVTVGTFDGVHQGHRALMEAVVTKARERNARSVVVTFDPHPREIINPGKEGVKLLTTLKERAEILEDLGVDVLLVIPFDRDFSLLSSEEFVRDIIFSKVGVSEFVIGYDHHFGRDRKGTIETIEKLGEELGFDSYVVSKQEMGDVTISSTVIRNTLAEEGDVKQAAEYLNRHYLLNGIVMHGDERGRTIGYPTANLKPEHENKVIPKNGVYAVKVRVNKKWYGGMMNIGVRPTFGEDLRTLEVNIFDFDREIYGDTIQVRFIDRIRDEKKFDGVDELKAQLGADKHTALQILSD